MLSIGGVRFAQPTVLAPMAGITDHYFRSILRQVGDVGLVTMEFISSEAVTRGVERELNKLAFDDSERPLSIQIYGSDVDRMVRTAAIAEEIGADLVDINMGCPANKVLKGCAGAALMGDLELAGNIIRAVRRTVSVPLTVKFRLGLDDRRANFLDLGRLCEDSGVDAVALHARTARQMFTGRADWDRIAMLKETVSIPVLGNGDVQEPEDALEMIRQTGCDGVMIGRGATRNPWIFSQIATRLAGGDPAQPTAAMRRELILRHFRMVQQHETEKMALHKLRTFTGWYTRGLDNGKLLRQRIGELGTSDMFIDAVEEFFARPPGEVALAS